MVKAPFIVAAGSQVNAEKLVSLLERTAAKPFGRFGGFPEGSFSRSFSGEYKRGPEKWIVVALRH